MMKIQNRVAMNSETAGEASINDAVLAQMNAEFMAREQKLLERIERLDAAYGEVRNSLKLVQTKLVKWKSRRDFTRETLYIDYVCQRLDMYRKTPDVGYSVYVRVCNPVGKSKIFAGRIGEIIKYNEKLCWVKWPAHPNVPVDTYDWNTLEIFIPESSFYYPLTDVTATGAAQPIA